MNRLAPLLLSASVVFSSGCFYLVEEGQGGVAERFPVPEYQISYKQRLADCVDLYMDHIGLGIDRVYPATYTEIEQRMVQSQRLHTARYREHALFQLQQAERLLRQMEQQYSQRLIDYSPSCTAYSAREFCL